MQVSIEKIDQFLLAYRAKFQSIRLRNLENERLRFKKLFVDVNKLRQDYLEQEKQTASTYNIFEVLNIHTLETVTHTPFLANLLDVKGSHGQGALFYKSFVEHIFSKNPIEVQTFLPQNEGYLNCYQEYFCGNGFIDIFIHNRNSQNPFAIILENKIYAGDQKDQLKRYYTFARSHLNLSDDKILLVYLTINGRFQDSEHSIDQETRRKLQNKNRLIQLSYRYDIPEILSSALPAVKAQRIKEIIYQYTSILQKL
jgi:hypothetical protein